MAKNIKVKKISSKARIVPVRFLTLQSNLS